MKMVGASAPKMTASVLVGASPKKKGLAGIALNTGSAYHAEDVVAAMFKLTGGVAATGIWNFNAPEKRDSILISGTEGEIRTPVFADEDVVVAVRVPGSTIPRPFHRGAAPLWPDSCRHSVRCAFVPRLVQEGACRQWPTGPDQRLG